MRTEIRAAVEAAAVTEAARLCEQALAGMSRVATASTAAQRARAKRYQLDEFRPAYAKAQRIVCDACRPEQLATREEFLAALDLYCAAGVAEVERRFAHLVSAGRRAARLRKNEATRSRNHARLSVVAERPRMTGHCVGPNGAEPFKWGK